MKAFRISLSLVLVLLLTPSVIAETEYYKFEKTNSDTVNSEFGAFVGRFQNGLFSPNYYFCFGIQTRSRQIWNFNNFSLDFFMVDNIGLHYPSKPTGKESQKTLFDYILNSEVPAYMEDRYALGIIFPIIMNNPIFSLDIGANLGINLNSTIAPELYNIPCIISLAATLGPVLKASCVFNDKWAINGKILLSTIGAGINSHDPLRNYSFPVSFLHYGNYLNAQFELALEIKAGALKSFVILYRSDFTAFYPESYKALSGNHGLSFSIRSAGIKPAKEKGDE